MPRDMPQPGQRLPVTSRIGHAAGSSEFRNRRGSSGPGTCTAAEPSAASENPVSQPASPRRCGLPDLAQFLALNVPVLVNGDHLTALAARARDDRPDDPPDETSEDREDGVQSVIDRLAAHEDR